MRTKYGVFSTTPSYEVQSARFKYIVLRMKLLSAIVGEQRGRKKSDLRLEDNARQRTRRVQSFVYVSIAHNGRSTAA